jgi:hypothetical protein
MEGRQAISDPDDKIRYGVAFCNCKEVAERIGLGFELPSKNDSREINCRGEWISTAHFLAPDQALFGFWCVASP